MKRKPHPRSVHLFGPAPVGDREIKLRLPPGALSLLIESPDGTEFLAVGVGELLAKAIRDAELGFRRELEAREALRRANGRGVLPLRGGAE